MANLANDVISTPQSWQYLAFLAACCSVEAKLASRTSHLTDVAGPLQKQLQNPTASVSIPELRHLPSPPDCSRRRSTLPHTLAIPLASSIPFPVMISTPSSYGSLLRSWAHKRRQFAVSSLIYTSLRGFRFGFLPSTPSFDTLPSAMGHLSHGAHE
jgi:hypothetical protein